MYCGAFHSEPEGLQRLFEVGFEGPIWGEKITSLGMRFVIKWSFVSRCCYAGVVHITTNFGEH